MDTVAKSFPLCVFSVEELNIFKEKITVFLLKIKPQALEKSTDV